MNVLIMTDKLTTGGAENYFCKLENQLMHPELVVYTAAGPGELYEQLTNKVRLSHLSRRNHLANLLTIKRRIIESEIDLIHANSLRMVLYAVVLKKYLPKKLSIIYTKHNQTMMEKRFRPFLASLVNRHLTRVITVSDDERLNLVQLGVHPSKITTIYNGVDLQQFVYEPKKQTDIFKIGILARLSSEKNHELFLEIAKRFTNDQQVQFYIGGQGPEYTTIRKMIRNSGLAKQVHMMGDIQDPAKFIKEMHVLLLTSHREVFPMVILEAMAVGTPIISVDTGGIKEAIEIGKTGFLVSDYSVDHFCHYIHVMKNHHSLRVKMAENANQRVQKNFSQETMIRETIQQYLFEKS